MKWYMEMPTWDTGSVSVSLESVSACGHRSTKKWLDAPLGQRPTVGLRLSTLYDREAEEVLSGALRISRRVWSREEVMGQYGNLYSSPCPCFSHTAKALTPKKIKESYIFITKCCRFFIPYGYTTQDNKM